MFKIHGNDIYLTRGDNAALNIQPQLYGEEYELDVAERLMLRIYELGSGATRLEMLSEGGTGYFEIQGKDTRSLKGTYGFEIKLVFPNGTYDTIIGEAPTYTPKIHFMEG